MPFLNVPTLYLEQHEPPALPEQPLPAPLSLCQVAPPGHFYQYLYLTIGSRWVWVNRRHLSREALQAWFAKPEVELWVLYRGGIPAGMAELDVREPRQVQLIYFGLMPERIGERIGQPFLQAVLQQAWRHAPAKVWLHTCALDHPGALRLYQKLGFRVIRSQRLQQQIPAGYDLRDLQERCERFEQQYASLLTKDKA
jgi:GNAT superfamily N-acetyltransferase